MAARKGDPCTIEGCSKPILGRGWCSMHYATWQRHGDPLAAIQRRLPPGTICSEADCGNKAKRQGMCDKHRRREMNHGETTDPRRRRFWSKIDKNGPIPEGRPDLGPCWVWTGYVHEGTGYGHFGVREGTRLVHRIAYQYLVGPIPRGLHLDHLCRNRRCVNAEGHLEPVTPRENIKRGDQGAFWGYVPEEIPVKPVIDKPATCTEDDGLCGGEIYKRTICRKHYRRWLRDPNVERPSKRTPEQRFWAKVDKDGSIPEHVPELGACWLWTAGINNETGYGRFAVRHGKMMDAHRYSYLLTHGSIPEGYEVHHLCHRRRCLRPEHLQALTPAANKALRKVRR